MADKRESGRLKDGQAQRVLDDAARRRRQKKALDALEEDNFQDDPHADLKMNKKAPKFEETHEIGQTRGKKRKNKNDHYKQRFKKNLTILKEEEIPPEDGQISYSTAKVPPSKFPERKFCSVCGFPSPYTCVKCGLRYCSGKCLRTHEETRCIKWVA